MSQTNTQSIVSLTLGILSLMVPFLGIFLGIGGIITANIAMKQIAYSDEGGKGLAISGMICSIVGLIIQLFTILAWIFFFGLAFLTG
ncbi:hypothetical protein JMA_32230 [Jeotgalibacillus malaysiensis]|uniref:DUF4190 domain-containing protein n=1 Tax=Jeotgalibacillus malaysiensis TaxID=1508404 RepID=A0A0B5AQJ8_9BACL|nr:DUF4190 domain-containing protein [Jeotgalibacillus malaysiensis]AJD92540.1 hypothetical protein JMA_32230 [Jeotgalibacillus malaysiensis]